MMVFVFVFGLCKHELIFVFWWTEGKVLVEGDKMETGVSITGCILKYGIQSSRVLKMPYNL